MVNTATRREFLAASVAPLAMQLASSMSVADNTSEARRAMSVILLYLDGGADNKSLFLPDDAKVPKEFRGPFSSIQTSVPGIQFSELLSKTSVHADRMSIVRSIMTGSPNHPTSAHNMLSGSYKDPVAWKWGNGTAEPGKLPYALILSPQESPYKEAHATQRALGFEWYDTGGALESNEESYTEPEEDKIPYDALKGYFRSSISSISQSERQRLRQRLDLSKQLSVTEVQGVEATAYDQNKHLAASLFLGNSSIHSALHPDAGGSSVEYQRRLASYGGNNYIAQSMLLAARLSEQGTRFITVNHSHYHDFSENWDDHSEIEKYSKLKAPPLDAAIAGLIGEIRSGRLENTLLVIATDFDRTPKVNKRGGRDHWHTGTLVMAAPEGKAIVGGSTYGEKTYSGEVTDNPLFAANGDVVRTIIHAAADGNHNDYLVPNEKRAREIMVHP